MVIRFLQKKNLKVVGLISGLAITCGLFGQAAMAARIADIQNTRHNFSANPVYPNVLPTGQTRDTRARDERQICVFCHTPHAAERTQTPIWNRNLSTATYNTYNSASLDSTPDGVALDQPNGISKLCLSCHDGTMAIGAVSVLNGSFTDRNPATADTVIIGTSPGGTMAPGEGIATGFTRYLGTDLTNDHPISVVFDANLFNADGEMRNPSSEPHLIVRGAPGEPRPAVDDVPLEATPRTGTGGLVQCNSCHDPHIRDTTDENIKFLRLNRLQKANPADGPFSKTNDIICLACHNKAGWAKSAHANPAVANEIYTAAAADVREFAPNTQVWESACLACHDTHTVVGSRRLLREGVDGPVRTSSTGYQIKSGTGQFAVEETCYACHSADRATLQGQGTVGFEVPDIKTDFTTMARHMPITTRDQAGTFEAHNIGSVNPDVPTQRGKDFVESRTLLGNGNLRNRHAECTDCHNIHRVIKNRSFNADAARPDPAGTHNHTAPHTNIASGVLKGIWGVEPIYGSTAFNTQPTSFIVKRGNPVPDAGASTALTSPWLTREYQICFKCHSNYGFGNNAPTLGSFTGGTPSGTNGMTRYTNIAMEYQSPASHMGEGAAAGTGATGGGNNHRSWHPVMRQTGRTPAVRNANPNNWRAPFNGAVGTQTMYCTDCHGSDTDTAAGAVPRGGENGFPWGPHGSNNDFLLKGPWSGNRSTNVDGTGNVGTGGPGSAPQGQGGGGHLCFKCHEFAQYGTASDTALGMGGMGGGGGGGAQNSGFATGGCMGGCMGATLNNLHIYHHAVVNTFRCNLCHVAIPHGWKNKVFLVNLNDVGPEAGLAAGTQVRNGGGGGGMAGGGGGAPAVTFQPYYNRAALKVVSFALSGQWVPANCGSAGAPGNGATGVNWMFMSSEACNNLP